MQYKREIKRDMVMMLLRYLVSMPFIYGMFLPLVLLDVSAELYHRICFALYGIPFVQRSRFIFLNRGKLSYLPWWDKINCAYCGYGNGLLAYVSQIAAETERYWCGIKHPKKKGAYQFPHHKEFLPYGDAGALEQFAAEVPHNVSSKRSKK